MGKQIVLPHRVWGQLNLAWAVFFAILGVVNLFRGLQLHHRPMGQLQAVRRDRVLARFYRRAEFVAREVHERG